MTADSTTPITEAVMRRFWAKVVIDPSGHLLWTSTTNRGGYGMFRLGPRNLLAHRFAYEALVGPIPEGLQIDHLCRIRHCVAPNCLEPVTPRENTMRSTGRSAINAAKTHCDHGHEFTEENTRRTSHGKRQCKECQRTYDREYKAQRWPENREVLNARARARYATRDRAWKEATKAAARARRAARKGPELPDPLVVRIVEVMGARGADGLTAPQVARAVFQTQEVSRARLERVRSRLDKLSEAGRLARLDDPRRTVPAVYVAANGGAR